MFVVNVQQFQLSVIFAREWENGTQFKLLALVSFYLILSSLVPQKICGNEGHYLHWEPGRASSLVLIHHHLYLFHCQLSLIWFLCQWWKIDLESIFDANVWAEWRTRRLNDRNFVFCMNGSPADDKSHYTWNVGVFVSRSSVMMSYGTKWKFPA